MRDPKPQRRIVSRSAGIEKLIREGRCRVTGSNQRLTRFHLVGRDLGGDDVDDNLIPVSHDTHMDWEHSPDGKQRLGPAIWSVLTADEKHYVIQKKGPEYVRRYYGVELAA